MTGLGNVAGIPPGEGRAYAVDGEQVAVFRLRDGSVRALDAVCPHRGGPLADGLVDQDIVVCPLHGNIFRLDDGASLSGAAPVRCYAVRVDADGEISLDVSVPEQGGQRDGQGAAFA